MANCNYDGFASSPYTIAVGSVTHKGGGAGCVYILFCLSACLVLPPLCCILVGPRLSCCPACLPFSPSMMLQNRGLVTGLQRIRVFSTCALLSLFRRTHRLLRTVRGPPCGGTFRRRRRGHHHTRLHRRWLWANVLHVIVRIHSRKRGHGRGSGRSDAQCESVPVLAGGSRHPRPHRHGCRCGGGRLERKRCRYFH